MKFSKLTFIALFAFFARTAYAQQVSHSDVFFTYGEIQIEIAPQDGRFVIPQTMPTSGFFAQANDNPGFFSEQDVGGGTGPNDVVGYNVLSDLMFWNDGKFSAPRPTTEVRIINNPRSVEDVLIGTGTGVQRASFDPLRNSIGQSSDGGDFHAHVDFRLQPLSADPEETPLHGVYGLKLSLSSDNPAIMESDPFFIVYRFGIDDAEFTRALDDFDSLLGITDGDRGDFDLDGLLTASDIDLLSIEVLSGNNTMSFDLTNDSVVDELDRLEWVESLAQTKFGDADLNQRVDFSDFLTLSASFGRRGGWESGDFDGNGRVEFSDFLMLSSNFGEPMQASRTVPEPRTSVSLLCVAVFVAFANRRKREV